MSSSKAARSRKTERSVDTSASSETSLEVATLVEIEADHTARVIVGGVETNAGLLQSARADIELLGLKMPCEVLVGRLGGAAVKYVVVAPAIVGLARTAAADADKLLLTAQSTIELRCGDSQITLTRDGKVTIRGVQVTSRASQTNKIKGATVNIN